ncbi:hypothetical protein BHE74_00005199 [Ensete ventricosum]|nr:hypothetical protein BHE74_00005199 [Ensete ventricosum]
MQEIGKKSEPGSLPWIWEEQRRDLASELLRSTRGKEDGVGRGRRSTGGGEAIATRHDVSHIFMPWEEGGVRGMTE